MQRVGGRRVNGVEEQDRENDDEGIDPGMLEGQVPPPSQQRANFPAPGRPRQRRTGGFPLDASRV